MHRPTITASAGNICMGTARLSILGAWDLLSMLADVLRSDIAAGDHVAALVTITTMHEVLAAITGAAEQLLRA